VLAAQIDLAVAAAAADVLTDNQLLMIVNDVNSDSRCAIQSQPLAFTYSNR